MKRLKLLVVLPLTITYEIDRSLFEEWTIIFLQEYHYLINSNWNIIILRRPSRVKWLLL